MLRLSKKADYALIALSYMAAPGQRPVVSAREMAEQHDIAARATRQGAAAARHAEGCCPSVQGINGGYRLARAPQTISVAEVVEAIDGPLTLTACADSTTRAISTPSATSATRCIASASVSPVRWPPVRSPSSPPTGRSRPWPSESH